MVWTTPGPGWPIFRYSLQDGRLVDRIGLADGLSIRPAESNGQYVDIRLLQAVDDVDGRCRPGLFAVTAEGVLYGLSAEGNYYGPVASMAGWAASKGDRRRRRRRSLGISTR